MKKIYLVIAGAFLMLLIITSIFLSFEKKLTSNTSKNFPFPTSISLQGSNQQNNQPSTSPIDISTINPVETEDFKLQYSSQLKKLVVERKTAQADEKFKEWAYKYNFPQLVDNDSLVSKVALGKGPEEEFNPILELLSIFLNVSQDQSNQPTPANSLTPYPNLTPLPTYSGNSTGKVYYAQCNGYGGISLPDGCTLCQAGCGPTTIAMIASSFLNSSYNPETVVNLYESNGSYIGCNGSGYLDAQSLMNSLGFTTKMLIYNHEKADTVAPELKNYIDAGWTFFVLANFRESGGGHFFWVTDVDDQGNIWAYDPYYGRYSSPPLNENSRYPFPLYRVAIGVRK